MIYLLAFLLFLRVNPEFHKELFKMMLWAIFSTLRSSLYSLYSALSILRVDVFSHHW